MVILSGCLEAHRALLEEVALKHPLGWPVSAIVHQLKFIAVSGKKVPKRYGVPDGSGARTYVGYRTEFNWGMG